MEHASSEIITSIFRETVRSVYVSLKSVRWNRDADYGGQANCLKWVLSFDRHREIELKITKIAHVACVWFFKGTCRLSGVKITHCNFTKTQVEVWYVAEKTDSDNYEEDLLQDQMSNRTNWNSWRRLASLHSSTLPQARELVWREQMAALVPTSP